MSDKVDKICPLCTEYMDLTDQQLKPCKCGYEVCVWCWNQIMEMAEKDKTEGRCPACRTPYDKERIVGMAANCERLVAEINSERKLKSQKSKPKLSEGRMHLSNVRVIQRNLVYIIGLPLNLADESLLQQREYFGQYGKVLKVSISKTATGIIQNSSNNSCCGYITYSKEEEAARCIQSVHSFVLDGRSLKACFGTTKYCHSWLKNMPCSIPDCLYLHELGAQEDSFTKDDLVSAFTRSRVQQNIGATNNLHRRSGNMLPPPADGYTDRNISSITMPDCGSSVNTIGNSDTGSYADSGTEKFNPPPGAWVMCVSSNVPKATSVSSSSGTLSHKPGTSSGPQVLASEIASAKGFFDVKSITVPVGSCEAQLDTVACGNIAISPVGTDTLRHAKESSALATREDEAFHADGGSQGQCPLISIDSHPKNESSCSFIPESPIYNHNLPITCGSLQDVNLLAESSVPPVLRESSIVENLLGTDDQQLSGSGESHNPPSMSCLLSSKRDQRNPEYISWQQRDINHHIKVDAHESTIARKCNAAYPLRSSMPVPSNGWCGNQLHSHLELDSASSCSRLLSDVGLGQYLDGCDNTKVSISNKSVLDRGESSIISSILSMDLDAWEDTMTSPQNLVNLLPTTDEQRSTLKLPSLRKLRGSSQSRFSFARQDDFLDQESSLGHSLVNETGSSYSYHYDENQHVCMDKLHDVSSKGSSVQLNSFPSHPFSASTFSVSKAPTSPPGFSISSRAVPPGFPAIGAVNYDEKCMVQNSAPSTRKVGSSVDVDYFDPAIMEAGDTFLSARLNNSSVDIRSGLSSHISPIDHDTERRLLMQQQRISVNENHRFADHFGSRASPPNDAYNVSSMLLGQSPPNNPSPFPQTTAQQVRYIRMSNGRWGGWDEIKSVHNVGMPELLMNGRLGFNKIIPSPEELKYHIPGSSNLYNRGFAL